MYSYLTNYSDINSYSNTKLITDNNYYNKLFYILVKKNIIYKLEDGCIILKKPKENFNFTIYFNLFGKPEFVVSEQNNIDPKIAEEINLNIDDYDKIEDIIYEIENKKSEYDLKIHNNNKKNFLNKFINKNLEKFIIELENKKNNIVTNKISANKTKIKTNNLFSQKACVEMIGDQIIKIYLSDNFVVEIDEFPNIKIFMTNFTFNGSIDLLVTIIVSSI